MLTALSHLSYPGRCSAGIILHTARVQAVPLGRGSAPLQMKCSANIKAKYSGRMVLGSTLQRKKKKALIYQEITAFQMRLRYLIIPLQVSLFSVVRTGIVPAGRPQGSARTRLRALSVPRPEVRAPSCALPRSVTQCLKRGTYLNPATGLGMGQGGGFSEATREGL